MVWRLFLYLQTQRFWLGLYHDERRHIRHHVKHYLILGDTLYLHGIDSILRLCLTHDEAEFTLNDYHSGAYGGHLFGLATTQKILCVGYIWPSIFKYFMEAVKKCPSCHAFHPRGI